MFCANCGHKINNNISFCPGCGSQINNRNNQHLNNVSNNLAASDSKNQRNFAAVFKNKSFLIGAFVVLAVLVIGGIVVWQFLNNANLKSRAADVKNTSNANLSVYTKQDYSKLGNAPDNNQNGGMVVQTDNSFYVSDGTHLTRYDGNAKEHFKSSSKDCNATSLNIWDEHLYYYDSQAKKIVYTPLNNLDDEHIVFVCGKTAPCNSVHNICIFDGSIYIIAANSGNAVVYKGKLGTDSWAKIYEAAGMPFCSQIDNNKMTICITNSSSYKLVDLDVCTSKESTAKEVFSAPGSIQALCINGENYYALVSGNSTRMIAKSPGGDYQEIAIPFNATDISSVGETTVAWNKSGDAAWYLRGSNLSHDVPDLSNQGSSQINNISSIFGYMIVVYNNGDIKCVNLEEK